MLLSLAGIFFLTLYPFRFAYRESARFLYPLSLNSWSKGGVHFLDVFLNILLFVPFGFGFAEKRRERGQSLWATFLLTYLAGALLSYLVELMQIYVPMRDSGWSDVFTNSSGAAVGALMYESIGPGIIAWFGARERSLARSLSLGKIGVLVGLAMGGWCIFAGSLQRQTKLADWTSDSFLAIGDSASLRPAMPWKGRVLELEIWNRAVPAGLARTITSRSSGARPVPAPVASYRFSGSAPFPDHRHFLPKLAWASKPPVPNAHGAALDGQSWLISDGPVPTLIASVKSSGKFAVELLCEPADTSQSEAQILSLSSPSGAVNLEIRQRASDLVFWFRNPFSMHRARMSWIVPHVFAPHQLRNLLLSFNGANVSLFVNGHDSGRTYDFGPGVALASYVRRVKAAELEGYGYIFYVLVFAPIGALLGFVWRMSSVTWIKRLGFLLAGSLLPAVVLEWVLVNAAGRSMSFHNIWFSVLLALGASLWMNADGGLANALGRPSETAAGR